MKHLYLSLALFLLLTGTYAQDVSELQEAAKTFLRKGDYANASLVLNRALQLDPKNISVRKDLAVDYWLQKENEKGLNIIRPIIDRNDADEKVFLIAAMLNKSSNDFKEAEKVYKKGIKKFPGSGVLYNDYGESLWSQGDVNAVKQWERGIEKDPEYTGNYFNAAKYYFFSTEKIWGLIYGEMFVNMETFTSRTAEMKNILFDGYKKLFSEPEYFKIKHDQENFESDYLATMAKELNLSSLGITVETLTMVRSRFILDWYEKYGRKFPFRLFEYHRQLLQDGVFDAYNQSIFGIAQNLQAYQNWTSTHSQDYSEFVRYQKFKPFKVAKGQYYHR